MFKVNEDKFNEILLYSKNNNMEQSKLYHYQLPKTGYCLYNLNYLKSVYTNGYVIVNLNDIIHINDLNEFYNNSNSNNSSSKLNIHNKFNSLFKKLFELTINHSYSVVYYLSIFNVISNIEIDDDTEYKKKITNISNELLSYLVNKYGMMNIIISYQFDKFNIRNKGFNDFVNDNIKDNVNYLSTNYNENKYFVGKKYDLDIENIYKYKNNNFLSCYKNDLKFISIDNLISKDIDKVFNLNNYFIDTKQYPSLSQLSNSYDGYKTFLKSNKEEFISIINANYEDNDNIKKQIEENINYKNGNTMIIGMNLDYKFDIEIINSFKSIINKKKIKINIISNNNDNNDKGILKFLDMLNEGYSNIKNVIVCENINNNKSIEKIINNIVKGGINLLININLSYEKLENIKKILLHENIDVDIVFYNFEINKRLRLALAYYSYYKLFSDNNIINKKNKYSNNKKIYIKLRKFIKHTYNYKINEKKNVNNCCKCCKCNSKYLINEIQIKGLPYLNDLDILDELDYELFL